MAAEHNPYQYRLPGGVYSSERELKKLQQELLKYFNLIIKDMTMISKLPNTQNPQIGNKLLAGVPLMVVSTQKLPPNN